MADSQKYDAIIIGAGHNGLVTANYLARAGKSVLVLEARDVVGGACVTEEFFPGTKWSSCAFVAGMMRPEIIRDLELESRFGLELYQGDALMFSLFPDGSHFFMWKEADRTIAEIERLNQRDGKGFVEFGLRLQRFASIVTPWLLKSPPSRSDLIRSFEDAGEEELFDEFVLLSVKDLLDRYLVDERLKALLTFFGMVSVYGGPSSPGTAYTWGHHSWGEFKGKFGQFGFVRGGMGGITASLARGAQAYGAKIRLSSPVDKVLLDRGRAVGVKLVDGEEIRGACVISNADPKRSLLKLLEPAALDPAFRAEVENIDTRGSMARIHLLVDELPQYLPFPTAEAGPQHHGHQMLGASMEAYEQAFEAQRRGVFPEHFVIEAVTQSVHDPSLAPEGLHTMTLGVQQLPSQLSGTTWTAERERWADLVLEDLFHYAPNLRQHILARHIITPEDLDREYNITDGNIFHGAMVFDQLFGVRPLAGIADYRTPVEGYYMCGVGTHPGGGVMGANGHNAAAVVLQDLGAGGPSATVPRGSRPRHSGSLTSRFTATGLGRWSAYQVARRPSLRRITSMATKTRR
ncbi:MAG TPA: NAD(P)/FAD-dependent oxidoreductase [Rhodoglobus sp.]|nr:NAD(P)/FAD-dependent oxidoreductase [Rhodoglobus sp.]